MNSNRSSTLAPRPVPSGQPTGVQLAIENTVKAVLHWKKYLALTLVISVLAGLTAAYFFESRKYTFEGALLYTPNENTAPYYRPPMLGNLVHVIDTPAILEQLNKRCQLGEDLSELRRNVTVDLVPSGDALVVRVVRPDKAQAERVLETAMQCYADETRRISKQAIGRFVKEFAANQRIAQDRFDDAQAVLQAFLEDHDLKTSENLESAATVLQSSISELDLELEMASIELESAKSKRDRLRSLQAENAADISGSAESSQRTTLPIGATDSDRRQFLREQIAKEQEDSSYTVKLSVKERERERVKKLHGQGLISDAEMDRIDGELAILKAEQNTRVSQLQDQLSEVEQRLAQRLVVRSGAEDGNEVVLAGFAEQPQLLDQSLALLDLDIVGAQHKTKRLSLKLAGKLKELEQLAEIQKKVAPLTLAVAQSADEKQRLLSLTDQFEHAYKSEVDELKVVQAPTVAIDGVRSNAGKIFGVGLIAALGLLVAPLFLLELKQQTRPTPENIGRKFGLLLLGDFSHEKQRGENIATAALRIQRQLPERNAVLLAVGCSNRSALLAQSLAQCGESVVLVDFEGNASKTLDGLLRLPEAKRLQHGVSIAGSDLTSRSDDTREIVEESKHVGVFDYLRGNASHIELTVRPTQVANLSYLDHGTEIAPGELLDQARLRHIMDELKAAYSVVLVSGVRLTQRLRLECLVDHADCIVICSSESVLDAATVEATQDLIMMDGRILGIIV
jgi:hypothetical protein